MKRIQHLLVLLVIIITSLFVQTVHAAGKITLTPVSPAISEGQSQVIGINLDAAIPAGRQVTLSIISSNPETAMISPATISFTSADWSQTKYFTVNVPANGTYGDTRNILIFATASSNMAYYNGFGGGANLQVADTTPEPGTYNPVDPPDSPDGQAEETPQYSGDPSAPYVEDVITGQSADQGMAASRQNGLSEYDLSTNGLQSTPVSAAQRVVDAVLPGHTVPSETLSKALIGLTILFPLLVAGIVFIRRQAWWRRQAGRDRRWFYRHMPRKQGIKKSARTPKKHRR